MSSVPCGMGKREEASIPQASTVEHTSWIGRRSRYRIRRVAEADGLWSVSGSVRFFCGRITRDSSIADSWNDCHATQTFSQSVSHQSRS